MYVSQLKDLINRSVAAKEPIVLNKIFYWFGWDVMSDVIFGRPFLMLQYAEWHDAVIQLKRAMSLLGPISPVYWLAHLAFKFIPGVWVVKDWFETIDLCRQRMQDRLKVRRLVIRSDTFLNEYRQAIITPTSLRRSLRTLRGTVFEKKISIGSQEMAF